MSSNITTVKADSLTIDPRVQRKEGIDEGRVAKMAQAFNPDALGTITISKRKDGTLVIIDGAHRSAAARAAGHKNDIPATVHTGLTLQQEAELFVLLNTFKQPSAISRFLARVVMGEPEAVQINTIVNNHGWRILQSNDPGCIAAIGALERIYRNGAGTLNEGRHPHALDWTLDIITAAWEHDGASASAHLLLAVAQLYGRFGGAVDAKKLVLEMQHTRPDVLVGKGKVLRDLQGGTVSAAIAKTLVGLHNKKRRSNLLPEWVWTR